MINKWIIYLNKKWENIPNHIWPIAVILTVAIVVFGVTSKSVIIKSIFIPVLLLFCLIRIWGIGLTKKN